MLFDGFQTTNNVRTAEARVRAANESLRNTEQNILFNAASAYHGCHPRPPDRGAARPATEFLNEQVRAARSRFEVGEGTRTDVAQAEASRSAAVAQLAAARAQALASAATYHQIVGEEPGKLKSPSARQEPSQEASTRRSRSRKTEHPAIIATEHLVDAAGFTVKAAEGALLPQFSASAGVSRNYRNTSPAPSPFLSSDGDVQLGKCRPAADGADLPGRAGRSAGAPVQGIAWPGAHRSRRQPRPGPCRRRLGVDAVRCGAPERRRQPRAGRCCRNWR